MINERSTPDDWRSLGERLIEALIGEARASAGADACAQGLAVARNQMWTTAADAEEFRQAYVDGPAHNPTALRRANDADAAMCDAAADLVVAQADYDKAERLQSEARARVQACDDAIEREVSAGVAVRDALWRNAGPQSAADGTEQAGGTSHPSAYYNEADES